MPPPRQRRLRSLTAPLVVAAGAVAATAAVWLGDPTTPGGLLPLCPTKLLTGVVCPGCGSLRMVYHLLHGDLGAAAHHNLLALVALPVLVAGWVAWMRTRWRGLPARPPTDLRWAMLLVGVLLVGWAVVRNLPFEPFTALRV